MSYEASEYLQSCLRSGSDIRGGVLVMIVGYRLPRQKKSMNNRNFPCCKSLFNLVFHGEKGLLICENPISY